jgi:hypothetical protein
MKIHPVFHVSLLEPKTKDTLQQLSTPDPPPPVEINDNLEFEVENILDSKVTNRQLRYLVKWMGYDHSENTWEKPENVENAKELVDQFHTKYPNKPKPKGHSEPSHKEGDNVRKSTHF